MATKVVTGKVRFSYVSIFEPKQSNDGGDPKYSVTLLIPKTDTATCGKIKAAIKDAADSFRSRNGASSLPATPANTVHDGDGLRPSGDPFGPECKGCLVLTVNNKNKPVIVDAAGNEILNSSDVYSGCYGRASINFFAYSRNGKKGISASLLAIQKLADGEPFGTVGSASDFNDGFTDATGSFDDDLPWM